MAEGEYYKGMYMQSSRIYSYVAHHTLGSNRAYDTHTTTAHTAPGGCVHVLCVAYLQQALIYILLPRLNGYSSLLLRHCTSTARCAHSRCPIWDFFYVLAYMRACEWDNTDVVSLLLLL